jgi:hypothetical protein
MLGDEKTLLDEEIEGETASSWEHSSLQYVCLYGCWSARGKIDGQRHTWDIPVTVEEFTAGQADFLEHDTADTGKRRRGSSLGEKVGGINTRRRAS